MWDSISDVKKNNVSRIMKLQELLFLFFGTFLLGIPANAQRVEYTTEDSLRVVTLLQKRRARRRGRPAGAT